MKKFFFRLQRVLDIKSKFREIQKVDLAKKASEYNIEIMKINKLKQEKKNAILDMKKSLSLEERRILDIYVKSNEEMQKYKMMDAKEKEKPFREALEKYLEKDREVKLLEKLKEKTIENFSKSSLKEEESIIDDFISTNKKWRGYGK